VGRQERAEILDDLEKQFAASSSVVLADFRGIDAEKTLLLRRKFKESSVKFSVAKNTLVKIAAEKAGFEGLDQHLSGPTALAVSEDPVAPSRVLKEFLKDNPDLIKIKGGYVEGALMTAEEVVALSNIPSRDVLLSKLVGSLQAPVTGFVNVMAGSIRNLVGVLSAIQAQKEDN